MLKNKNYQLHRLVRTPSSEIYEIHNEEQWLARIDLHYTEEVIHVCIIAESTAVEELEAELINLVENSILPTFQTAFSKKETIVSFYSGTESSHYGDLYEEDSGDEIFDYEYDDDDSKN